jgi:hypothetical protein
MEENKRLYPISGEVFNQRGLHLERAAAQGVTLPVVLWDTVYSEGQPPVAGFAFGMRLLACDI